MGNFPHLKMGSFPHCDDRWQWWSGDFGRIEISAAGIHWVGLADPDASGADFDDLSSTEIGAAPIVTPAPEHR